MPPYGIGTSFQPGIDQNGPDGRRGTPVQEAIRLLSLRLPSRVTRTGPSWSIPAQSRSTRALMHTEPGAATVAARDPS